MKETTTIIKMRFIEIKEDETLVLKTDELHKDGYYDFYINKDELKGIFTQEWIKNTDNKKLALYEHFARSYNRSFMEFLMCEMYLDSLYLASIFINDTAEEYSYLEYEYMDDTYLSDSVDLLYGEEFGMLSDFDYYPYGL